MISAQNNNRMIDFEILRHDHNLFSLQTFEVSIDMTYTIHTFLIKEEKNHDDTIRNCIKRKVF